MNTQVRLVIRIETADDNKMEWIECATVHFGTYSPWYFMAHPVGQLPLDPSLWCPWTGNTRSRLGSRFRGFQVWKIWRTRSGHKMNFFLENPLNLFEILIGCISVWLPLEDLKYRVFRLFRPNFLICVVLNWHFWI